MRTFTQDAWKSLEESDNDAYNEGIADFLKKKSIDIDTGKKSEKKSGQQEPAAVKPDK